MAALPSRLDRYAKASRPEWLRTWWQQAFLAVLTIALGARFAYVHATHPIDPQNPLPAHALFGWADQGAYYRAALAWARGDLGDVYHLYPAGYSMLAAIFVPLFPEDPFFMPDLLCWASCLWIFAALAGELFPSRSAVRALGGGIFFCVTVFNVKDFYTWEIPWTSTPACVCTLLTLVLALRYGARERLRHAFLAALASGLLVLFRPTDFLIIAAASGMLLLVTEWRATRHRWLAFLALTGLGFSIGPILLAATHIATHGLRLGSYLEHAGLIGFEWRLLPLRWVTLLLNPRPLYPQGLGLAQAYWWIMPGIAGIAGTLVASRGRRLQHACVGGAAIIYLCVYLCFRDLHAPGLFGYMNQHYFKWTIPLFALYAVELLHLIVVQRRLAAAGVGLAIVFLLSCWRAELVILPGVATASVLPDGSGLSLPNGLQPLNAAYLVASPDNQVGLYLGPHTMDTAAGALDVNAAFKIFPVPFGFMLAPLRPLQASPATLHLGIPLRLDPTKPVFTARQDITFGLPCFVLMKRKSCDYQSPLLPKRQ